MNKFYKFKKLKLGVCLLMLSLPMITGCQFNNNSNNGTQNSASISYTPTMQDSIENIQVDENCTYTYKEEVAAYIHKYKKLPSNYISKPDAYDLGWEPNAGGALDDIDPGKTIGSGLFKNIEKLIPQKEGQVFYECDVNYLGGVRGQERIIYSNDVMIYYTPDHYEIFELLYE